MSQYHIAHRRAPAPRRGFTIVEAIASIVLLALVIASIGRMNIFTARRTRAEAQITARNAVFIQQTGWINSITFNTLDSLFKVTNAGDSLKFDTLITAQNFTYRRQLTVWNRDEKAPAPIRRRTVTLRIVPSRTDGTADTSIARTAIARWDRWQTLNPLNGAQ